jgi:flagellar biosynthesis protein FlhF
VNLKTYRAASIAEALGQIKRDLGPAAVILHTRTFRHGGLLGFRSRQMVEITASSNVNVARRGKEAPAPSAPRARADAHILNKAYAVQPRPAAPPAQYSPAESAAEPAFASAATAVLDAPAPAAVAAAPAAPLPNPGISSAMEEEIVAIKRLVGQVLQKTRGAGGAQPSMPGALFDSYLKLVESEVAADIADEVIGDVRDELNADELADDTIVHQAVLRRLAAYIPVCDDIPRPGRAADGRPLTIALVGPTGVGKTTTIAKLAATYKLRYGRKIGLLTCDTYRIAAVDQLRTYANIMGVPLRVAQTPAEVASACEAFADTDAILIDTAGRSQHDAGRLDELKRLVSAARPHQTHLVLSGAASESVMLKASERFRVLEPNRVIFTKLDETVSFGVLVNAARRIGARLSFVTTGQEVPDHIEPGRPERIARLVLEGTVTP